MASLDPEETVNFSSVAMFDQFHRCLQAFSESKENKLVNGYFCITECSALDMVQKKQSRELCEEEEDMNVHD